MKIPALDPRHLASRRSFLQGIVLASGGAALLAACGSDEDSASSSSAAPTTAGSPTTAAGADTTVASSTASTEGGAATTAGSSGGPSLDELIAAAKEEGSVVLYTNQDPEEADSTLAFIKDTFGLDAHVERLTSKDLNQRYAAERDAGRVEADIVVTGGYDFMNTGRDSGWWATVDALPALAEWPAEFWDSQVAIAGFLCTGITRNTDLVDGDGPAAWEDLFDPAYKDQIILIDPHTAGGTDYWLYLMRETYGDEFIVNLGKQNPQFQASATAALQALAAGAGKLALPTIRTSTAKLADEGAPVAHWLGSPTTGGTTLIAVSEGAKHPNAAKLLLNFFLTVEGQALINANGYSPLADVPGTSPLPDDYVAIDQTVAKAALPELYQLMGLTY